MNPKALRYIADVRNGFGMSEADMLTLCRLYRLPAHPARWSTETVEKVAAMLLDQGPSYQRVRQAAAQARAEHAALEARKERRKAA